MRKHSQQGEDTGAAGEVPQKQLIPEKGEEYLREVANIEDMPSPAEEEEAEKTLKEDKPQ